MSDRLIAVGCSRTRPLTATRITKWMSKLIAREPFLRPLRKWESITVTFVTPREIAALHGKYLDDPTVTDVMTFPYEPTQPRGKRSGDIVINPIRARSQGKKRNGFRHELLLYIAHGLDHLAGGRDDTPQDRAKMHAREAKWLGA